mmetsp:Transcript_31059/g.56317  ORF Transcript_31059/g.56317 Transcript_31059/m.56317 type:complete len:456 (+) Transcript_31059:50-1417(+)
MSTDTGYWSRLKPLVTEVPSQICCVVRHAERADAAFALFNGQAWSRSEDAKRWPLDPPLSDDGEVGASEAAEVLHGFAKRLDAAVDVVVTSPYLRCVQTAAVICNKLGPNTRLMIDVSVGEIFGPSVLGDTEPRCHRRPLQRLLQECKMRGVENACPKTFGTEPSWPETLSDGRQRFTESFLKYQHRSHCSCRSFVIVTHGDCVEAATRLFPMPSRVTAVEPGGMLLASRRFHKSSELWLSSLTSLSKWWKPSAGHASDALQDMTSEAVFSQPVCSAEETLGGWSVDSFLIHYASSQRSQETRFKSVEKNKAHLRSPLHLSPDRLEEVLDSFADKPRHEVEIQDFQSQVNRLMPARSSTGLNFMLSLRSRYSSKQDTKEEAKSEAQIVCDSEGSTSAWSNDFPDLTPDGLDGPSVHSTLPTPIWERSSSDPGPSSPSPQMKLGSSSLWQRRVSLG